MPDFKRYLSFLFAFLFKIFSYLKKAGKQLFDFLKKYLFEKRKRILSLFLGIILFALVHFARLGKHVIKQSDTIAKEAIERIDDVAFDNMRVGIETFDTYNKTNTLMGPKEKSNISKHKEVINLLKECYNKDQLTGTSALIDSCNASVSEHYKKLNDREALQLLREPFVKYYLHDLTEFNSLRLKVMQAGSDAEFDSIWNRDIKKMRIKENNFYNSFYTMIKEKKYVRDSLITYRDSLLKLKESQSDSL